MPRHGQKTAEETSVANSEAYRGAVVGAAKVIDIFLRRFSRVYQIYISPLLLFVFEGRLSDMLHCSGASLLAVLGLLVTSSRPSIGVLLSNLKCGSDLHCLCFTSYTSFLQPTTSSIPSNDPDTVFPHVQIYPDVRHDLWRMAGSRSTPASL